MVGGRYRLMSKLGYGGFGRVWKARDEFLDVDVAIKEVWLPLTASDSEQSERLARAAREARNAARLRDHPNIVAVHDVVIEDGAPWTVMRLVDGHSLAERLDADGPLPWDDTERIAAALLKALSAAHAAGIVHRDVKPANVMLTDAGEVLLTDFGIALRQADTALTAPGSFIGSLEYIAPERARGTDGLAASDLFSLGVALYQAVEGVSPFRRGTDTGTLTAVLFDEPPPPRRAGPLTPLIARLLDKDPDQRITVPEALALIDASPTAAEPPTPPDPAAPPYRTPLAIGLANERGADLNAVEDTDPKGRIRKQDVLNTADTLSRFAPQPDPQSLKTRPRNLVAGIILVALTCAGVIGAIAYRAPGDEGVPSSCTLPSGWAFTALQLQKAMSPDHSMSPGSDGCTWTGQPDNYGHAKETYELTLYTADFTTGAPGIAPPIKGAPKETALRSASPGSCTIEWPTSYGYGSIQVHSLGDKDACTLARTFVQGTVTKNP